MLTRFVKMHLMLCKNLFLHLSFLVRCWTFSFGKCTPKYICNILLMQKCIFAKTMRTFCFAKMHFCIKCKFLQRNICNILFCWTFYKVKLLIFLCKMCQNAFVTFAKMHFCKTKCTHQMHFCIKCIFATQRTIKCLCNIWRAKMYLMLPLHFVYKMLESGKMHFGCAKMHLMQKCIWCQNVFDAYILLVLNIFLWKMFSCALQKCICNILLHKMYASNAFDAYILCNKMLQMHLMRTFCFAKMDLMQKWIWCKNAFDAKMHFCITFSFGKCSAVQKCIWCWTFSFGKCSASHFPKENVQQNKMLQMYLMPKCIWCKNGFDALPKCILASNAFDAKMLFCVHFPKENVQHQIFQRKMFSKTKCYKCIWCFEKIYFCITFCWCKNAFDALPKCIWCKNAFDAKMHFCNAYIFLWKMFSCAKMHLMQKCIFATHHIFLWKMFSTSNVQPLSF